MNIKIIILVFQYVVTASAFPPAPHHTLHGIVRDQVGQTLEVEGAELILLKGGEEVGRTPITRGPEPDQNYELRIRIDANRPATQLYNSGAVPANGRYSLVVKMSEQLFYPIEVSNNLTAGKGGERVRLDLNLGADSDVDGLPDVWEQWQLFQAGLRPGEEGWDLSLIDRDGDLDGDGESNYSEYIAGTFAGDATERFELHLKEKTDTAVRLEFFAITSKVYILEHSPDGKTWTRIPFATREDGEPQSSYRSPGVGIQSAFCSSPDASARELYRLTVR